MAKTSPTVLMCGIAVLLAEGQARRLPYFASAGKMRLLERVIFGPWARPRCGHFMPHDARAGWHNIEKSFTD